MTATAFHDHFSHVANRYADFRPHYPAALFDFLASVSPRESLVWDCAAGNGQATSDLAQRFDHVIATDASREQIAAASARPGVEFRVAPAEDSGLRDESVNLITVAQALHWFDLGRFFDEARRVLKPGGHLAVWAYGIDEVDDLAINELVRDYYFNKVGPYWPPERRLVEEGYRGISFPFTEIAVPPLRMETRWTLDQMLGYFSTWSATSRYIKATGHNPIEPLASALSHVWGHANTARLIVWPLAFRVGRK